MDDHLLSEKRILVVEDEMLVMMAIEDMLTDLGCTSVTCAANVKQALILIEAEPFDLATLDLNLDGRLSYPVAKALAERGVPFAFSTGYGKKDVGDGFGSHPVLGKPFSDTQLVAVLKLLLTPSVGNPPALAA